MRSKMQRHIHWRRAFQVHVKICGHRAWRGILARFFHQMHRRRPVAVAVEECAADAAVEDALERLVIWLRFPLAYQLIAVDETPDPQSFVIRRTTSEAAVVRGVSLLHALHR